MTTFFQQTAQAMIAKHIDRFPLLKLDQVIDWQPIEQYLNRQRTRYVRDHRGRPAYPLLSMFKAVLLGQWHSLSDPELEHSLITRIDFNLFCRFDELSIPDYSTLCRYRNWLAQDDTLSELLKLINCQLTERAHTAAQLPQVDILNVGRLKLDNGFSPQALQLLKQNFEAGGMSLVYLNRRGFAPALFCGDCGHTFGCPNCSAKMVLHQRARQLRCHHCDHREPIPFKCPDCGNQDLTAVGHGTQRVEETLRAFLPKAAVVRVDRDSTAHKNDWADLYRRIADNEIDILVGTQMLAKGHDFARLNLVIVLNADGSLYSADFRAPERLFAELMQVSGRAGRADKPGKVLIQTQLPEHPVFAAVKAQDYAVFAENELNERQMFAMPPFGFQTAIRSDAPRVADAMEFLNAAKETLAPLLPESVSQFGAAPMLMVRLAERERAQIFLESTSRQDLHRAVSLWVQVLQQNRDGKIRWSVDVDVQEA